jgi:CRP-like cAMP-binding protein
LSGTNRAVKAGTLVFKSGDNADGMYLVRKGELVVFFEQDGKEVVLAKIPEGGMVGEMALFDRMPRSASVKASVDSEITHISLDDFSKLMKQIPKWFVGLMSALSSRLRTTNDRLKVIEGSTGNSGAAGGLSTKPYQSTLRILHTMELLWHRDGAKDGKDWTIQRKQVEDNLTGVFGESNDKVKAILDVLCSEGVLVSKMDSYKAIVLSMPNRASLRNFANFITALTKGKPHVKSLPTEVMDIMSTIVRLEGKAPYDQFTISLEELYDEAKATKLDSVNWKNHLNDLQGFGEFLKLTKTSSQSGLGLRVIKGELTGLIKNLSIFNKIAHRHID